MEDVEKIQEILGKYERASGQKINSDKTILFFSNNSSHTTKEQIKNLLERYSSLPVVVGRKKKAKIGRAHV